MRVIISAEKGLITTTLTPEEQDIKLVSMELQKKHPWIEYTDPSKALFLRDRWLSDVFTELHGAVNKTTLSRSCVVTKMPESIILTGVYISGYTGKERFTIARFDKLPTTFSPHFIHGILAALYMKNDAAETILPFEPPFLASSHDEDKQESCVAPSPADS